VNLYQGHLNGAITAALPELRQAESIEWVSPVARNRYAEYRDEEFLEWVGYPDLAGTLSTFWPSGGPCWDALARVHWKDPDPRPGIILVEAKSYPEEMQNEKGCRASEPARSQIAESLAKAKSWCRAERAGDWMGPLYQYANRIAHLYFFRELEDVPAFLVNLCFVADPRKPTSISEWQVALQNARATLGIRADTPFAADVFLDAISQELPTPVPDKPRQNFLVEALGDTRREWRFHRDDHTGNHQFYAFLNRGGRSSLRKFHACTGELVDRNPGRNRRYQDAFSHELNVTVVVNGPRSVDFERIPSDELAKMQKQVGLNPLGAPQLGSLPKPSILSGVDEVVDEMTCPRFLYQS
jgi:hypothetical protein